MYKKIAFLLCFIGACNTHAEIKESKKAYPIEGKFLRIEQSAKNQYNLYLKTKNDTAELFKSYLYLSKDEIALLEKTGNNIFLNVTEYTNQTTNEIYKVVNELMPVYEKKHQ